MAVDESVTVKGSPVRSLQKFIETQLTAEQRQALFAGLPAEYALFQRPILATEKVPVSMLNRFTEAAAGVRKESLDDFARRAGREAAGEAVKGIYRFFALVLTPTALLSKGSQMWSSLYNTGELRIDNQTGHSARIRLLNFPSERAGCLRLTGWMERMAEMTGAKDLRVQQTKCAANGAENCEWEITWAE